jgi:uncharacterized protein (DUF433 family)
LRRAGIPLQQIRPALDLVRDRLGVQHALASHRLFHDGAELLWEISAGSDVEPETRREARNLIVLRNGQYVFRQIVEQYLTRITYDGSDGFARQVRLPEYEVADLVANPDINFGRPIFADMGAPLDAVLSRIRAGEPLPEVAEDYGLAVGQVTEAALRASVEI